VTCNLCFQNGREYIAHLKTIKHKNCVTIDLEEEENVYKIDSCFKNRIVSYGIRSNDDMEDINEFLIKNKEKILNVVRNNNKILPVKIQFELFAYFLLPSKEEEEDKFSLKSFNTSYKILLDLENLSELYDEFSFAIKNKSEEFAERESGWAFFKMSHLEININKYTPLKGSSYIPLPKKIIKTKSCINIQNNDTECFMWCLVAAKFPAPNHAYRTSSYPDYKNHFNLDNIIFPVTFSQIKKIEEQNNLSINVYGLNENDIVVGPLFFNRTKKRLPRKFVISR
jgi:hypothetical protein